MATRKNAQFINAADIAPVVSVKSLIDAVKDAAPGVGGIVWEGWTGPIMAQGLALNETARNVWYTVACGAYAGGLRVAHFAKSTPGGAEVMAELRTRVSAHFPESARTLMGMSGLQVAALDVNQKRDRTDALESVQCGIDAIKKHIRKMEGKTQRDPKSVRGPDEILRDMLGDCLDYMRKDGGRSGGYDWKFDFGEVFDMVRDAHRTVEAACGITRKG